MNGKRVLLLNGYTYHKISTEMYSGGFRWRCSSTQSRRGRCSAFAVLTCDARALLRVSSHPHSHAPPVLNKTELGKLVTVSNGKQLFMLNNYTYHKDGLDKWGDARWRCSSTKNARCNAFVMLTEDSSKLIRASGTHTHPPPLFHITESGIYVKIKCKFITLQNGTSLLMINEYTFHKASNVVYSGGYRWLCSSRKSKKGRCNAFAVVTCDGTSVIRSTSYHCHDPPSYVVGSDDPKFITLSNGKRLLMFHGYTFHKINDKNFRMGARWRCSSKKKGCNAYVMVSFDDSTILKISPYHTHVRPNYSQTLNGVYVRKWRS